MQRDSRVPTYFPVLRVMVVDDQEYMRHLLTSTLRALGIRAVQCHADAVSAFEAIAEFKPSLLLTDWQMKPVDGLELVRRIRTADDSPDTFLPVVMVTGHHNADKVRQARDAGANDFLIKPVSAKAVYSRLRSTFEKPRPFIRSRTYFGPDRRRQDLGPPEGMSERRKADAEAATAS